MTVLAAPSSAHSSNLGYAFKSGLPSGAVSPHQLEIWLRALPTEHHYDPESVTCRVVSSQPVVETLVIRHPWTELYHYQIPVGLISLNDRRDKKIEAFSFGAELQIESNPEATGCVFESSAPILALVDPNSLATRLTAEVEALLGQQRAKWNGQRSDADFDEYLAGVDPFTLYVACLVSVAQRLGTLHPLDNRLHEILHFTDHEHKTLRSAGVWPLEPQSLDALLSQKVYI